MIEKVATRTVAANEIEKALLETLASMTGKAIDPTVSIDALRDYGIDSLGVYQVICDIEERLRIFVPDAALRNEKASIQEIAREIESLAQVA